MKRVFVILLTVFMTIGAIGSAIAASSESDEEFAKFLEERERRREESARIQAEEKEVARSELSIRDGFLDIKWGQSLDNMSDLRVTKKDGGLVTYAPVSGSKYSSIRIADVDFTVREYKAYNNRFCEVTIHALGFGPVASTELLNKVKKLYGQGEPTSGVHMWHIGGLGFVDK